VECKRTREKLWKEDISFLNYDFVLLQETFLHEFSVPIFFPAVFNVFRVHATKNYELGGRAAGGLVTLVRSTLCMEMPEVVFFK
jgi:hypothetical protein